ncbi:MAG: hypothetical protein AAF517_04780 [Planctomycetota bacterium]
MNRRFKWALFFSLAFLVVGVAAYFVWYGVARSRNLAQLVSIEPGTEPGPEVIGAVEWLVDRRVVEAIPSLLRLSRFGIEAGETPDLYDVGKGLTWNEGALKKLLLATGATRFLDEAHEQLTWTEKAVNLQVLVALRSASPHLLSFLKGKIDATVDHRLLICGFSRFPSEGAQLIEKILWRMSASELWTDADVYTASFAAKALAILVPKTEAAILALERMCGHKKMDPAAYAVQALAEFGDRAVPGFRIAARHESEFVRAEVFKSLQNSAEVTPKARLSVLAILGWDEASLIATAAFREMAHCGVEGIPKLALCLGQNGEVEDVVRSAGIAALHLGPLARSLAPKILEALDRGLGRWGPATLKVLALAHATVTDTKSLELIEKLAAGVVRHGAEDTKRALWILEALSTLRPTRGLDGLIPIAASVDPQLSFRVIELLSFAGVARREISVVLGQLLATTDEMDDQLLELLWSRKELSLGVREILERRAKEERGFAEAILLARLGDSGPLEATLKAFRLTRRTAAGLRRHCERLARYPVSSPVVRGELLRLLKSKDGFRTHPELCRALIANSFAGALASYEISELSVQRRQDFAAIFLRSEVSAPAEPVSSDSIVRIESTIRKYFKTNEEFALAGFRLLLAADSKRLEALDSKLKALIRLLPTGEPDVLQHFGVYALENLRATLQADNVRAAGLRSTFSVLGRLGPRASVLVPNVKRFAGVTKWIHDTALEPAALLTLGRIGRADSEDDWDSDDSDLPSYLQARVRGGRYAYDATLSLVALRAKEKLSELASSEDPMSRALGEFGLARLDSDEPDLDFRDLLGGPTGLGAGLTPPTIHPYFPKLSPLR